MGIEDSRQCGHVRFFSLGNQGKHGFAFCMLQSQDIIIKHQTNCLFCPVSSGSTICFRQCCKKYCSRQLGINLSITEVS